MTLLELSDVDEIVKNYDSISLSQLCSLQMGFPFKSDFFDEEIGVPLIRVRSLKAQACDIKYQGEYDPSYIVKNGDILIGMDGDFQPCIWNGGTALLNQRVCRLTNFQDDVNPYYVFQAIKKPLADIENVTHYTTVKHLSGRTILDIEIPFLGLNLQNIIAHTLYTVDNAIQARRREVALERERKAALMQHLFTHGTRGEATKQTEIGEMPQGWELKRLGDIAEVAYGLTVNEARRLREEQAPYLTVANVSRGALHLSDIKNIGVTNEDAKRYRLHSGDVLIVEGNGNPKLLGSAAIWNDELPFVLHQNHLIRTRLHDKAIKPNWLMHYLNSDEGRSQLLGRSKTSSGLHSINSSIVASLIVPSPKVDEQIDILTVIESSIAYISSLEHETQLLEELFRALLEELMTGRLAATALIAADEAGGGDGLTPNPSPSADGEGNSDALTPPRHRNGEGAGG